MFATHRDQAALVNKSEDRCERPKYKHSWTIASLDNTASGAPAMIQFLADHVDQLDLALDQLAMRDRNFSRFALMLIDNVVELTLHQYAQDKSHENDFSGRNEPPWNDPKAVAAALGPHFDSKVRLARNTGMLSVELSETILHLHTFRNTAYHRGLRQEGILHSLALFYFRSACDVLANYSPMGWSSSSRDQIPHRATKYLGKPNCLDGEKAFKAAWARLRQVTESMGNTLVSDLHNEMRKTIESVNDQIQFLADESPDKKTRKQVIIDCKAWPFAFSDDGKAYAATNNCPQLSVGGYVDWLALNYQWPTSNDPIPSWRKRA